MMTASSDVTEMARTFCGGWLGTEDKQGDRRNGNMNIHQLVAVITKALFDGELTNTASVFLDDAARYRD